MTPRDAFRRQLLGWLIYHRINLEGVRVDDYCHRGLVFCFGRNAALRRMMYQQVSMGFKSRKQYEAFFDFAYKHGYRFEFLSWNVIEFEPVRTSAEVCALFGKDKNLPF